MLSKLELSREIEKVASNYSDIELFSNPRFYELLQSTITSVTHTLGRNPIIEGFCDPKSYMTACTDGDKVMINTLGPLIREFPTNWEKYVSNFGHVTHECGHILFTDFSNMNPLRQGWNKDKIEFYPKDPEVDGVEEFKEYLNTHPCYKRIYVKEMMDICNIMEDVYIENCLYEFFAGLCAVGLTKTNEELYRLSCSLDAYFKAAKEGNISFLTVAKGIIQIRKKLSKEPKKGEEWDSDYDDLLKEIEIVLSDVDEEFDALSWECDGIKRCELLNILFIKLQPLFPRFDEDENDDTNASNADNSLEISNNLSRATGVTEESKGTSKSVIISSLDKQDVASEKEKAGLLSKTESSFSDEVKKYSKEIAKDECESKDEANHVKELQQEANDINSDKTKVGNDEFDSFSVKRSSKQDSLNYSNSYNFIYKDVKKTADSLVKKISNILKDGIPEEYESNLLMGNRFNSCDVFRGDGKYFSKSVEPADSQDVVFGVLVDESGSMYGDKIAQAKKVSILLEDVLRRLNIPFLLVGHTTEYGGSNYGINVSLRPYVDFNTNDNADKYRLCMIEADSGNIDGAAITYMGERLLKRPEALKVLIVISDGEPAGHSYYADDECEDTILAIKQYRKKGIKVFGAIVDEFDNVSKLYGKDYSFNCQSNGSLEKELIKLIKKYCLIK